MSYQLQSVIKAKSKALKVFTDTKKKFEAAIKEAVEHTRDNKLTIARKLHDIEELEEVNTDLELHISDMQNSINQINNIVGA